MSNAFDLPETTRTRIIRSARHCFAANGFPGTSTRQIAEDAKVAQSLLLYHFKSKDGLWQAVMTDSFKRALRILNDAAIAEQSKSATDQLGAGVRALVDVCAGDPDFHRLAIFESHDPSDRFQSIIESHLDRMAKRAAHFIKAAQEEGTVHDGDPYLLYISLFSTIGSIFSFARRIEIATGRKGPSRAETERIARNVLFKSG
jgi:TetR/AcrR family transcriptional regulator